MVPFSRTFGVRFSDTDALGHVNHARFLAYLEDARIDLFVGAFGLDEPAELGVIVARVEVDYVRPIFYGSDVTAWVWLERVGTRSFTLDYRLDQGGETAARARTVIVAYDYVAGASRALSAAEVAGLRAHATERPPGDPAPAPAAAA